MGAQPLRVAEPEAALTIIVTSQTEIDENARAIAGDVYVVHPDVLRTLAERVVAVHREIRHQSAPASRRSSSETPSLRRSPTAASIPGAGAAIAPSRTRRVACVHRQRAGTPPALTGAPTNPVSASDHEPLAPWVEHTKPGWTE